MNLGGIGTIYENVVTGVFKERPNRFIAIVDIEGREERCHVKNTGRCKELLVPGAKVVLSDPMTPGRKTRYDLIAVYKDSMLVNMDSQAPNTVCYDMILETGMFPDLISLRREYTHGDSRFDMMAQRTDRNALIEVKGVTLEEDGLALFPDAPTERGVKHVRELIRSVGEGYDAYLVFIIQMKGPAAFTTNRAMHPEFADAVRDAAENGVHVLAFDCLVSENEMVADRAVRVML